MTPNKSFRVIIGILCVAGLVAVFLLQKFSIARLLDFQGRYAQFVIDRSIRFFLNDLFAIGLIYALFNKRSYVIFSVYVQLAGVILFLIPYFVIKYYYPVYNGPMINYLHRLILNPTLLVLLMVAFYYKENIEKRQVS